MISDVILLLDVILAIFLPIAIYFARRHKGNIHHWLILGIFLIHLVFAVSLMVYSFFLLSSLMDVTPLLPHMIFSIVVLILAVFNIALGFKWRAKDTPVMVLPSDKRIIHGRIGIILLLLWYLNVISGTFVYFMLYG